MTRVTCRVSHSHTCLEVANHRAARVILSQITRFACHTITVDTCRVSHNTSWHASRVTESQLTRVACHAVSHDASSWHARVLHAKKAVRARAAAGVAGEALLIRSASCTWTAACVALRRVFELTPWRSRRRIYTFPSCGGLGAGLWNVQMKEVKVIWFVHLPELQRTYSWVLERRKS